LKSPSWPEKSDMRSFLVESVVASCIFRSAYAAGLRFVGSRPVAGSLQRASNDAAPGRGGEVWVGLVRAVHSVALVVKRRREGGGGR
jgi:hypothetical protein